MHITILSAGSQGDVQPYLALAVRLKNEGYKVRFAANSNFADLAAQYGLDFFPIQVNSFQVIQEQSTRAWLESEDPVNLIRHTIRAIRPLVNQFLVDSLAACKDSELIVYHSYALPFVYYFGKYLQIPCIPASIYPMPTREHIALPLNIKKSPGKVFNLISHQLVDQISWQVFLPVVRKFLKEKVRISISSPYRQILREQLPILCGYSPTVLPRPYDLPEQVKVTGYWFLDPAPNWQPESNLVTFLKTNPKPMYVGFGSMGDPANSEDTTNIVLRALAETGQRAVLAAGWSGLGIDQHLPKNVFSLSNVPHTWLFPKMAAIVHHGGSGTTGAALRAGVPNVVIPHFGDQYFWANRVAELGIGPEPISRKKLSVDRLAQAISIAINDQDMLGRARALGAKIRAEDGIGEAIRAIRQYIN